MLTDLFLRLSPFQRPSALLIALALGALLSGVSYAQDDTQPLPVEHQVVPGDTWSALAMRFGVTREALREANWHPNPARNPVIGDVVALPAGTSQERMGRLYRGHDGGLLTLAAAHNLDPWVLAGAIELKHPYRPLHGQAILLPGGDLPPRDLPAGFQSLELSAVPAQPGWPLALRAVGDPRGDLSVQLGTARFDSFVNSPRVVAVGGTGAFFAPGAPELTITVGDTKLWAQPWRVAPGTWDFDQITLTGEAAAIDQEAIAAERQRMFQIWSQVTPQPLWRSAFRRPIDDFLQISSTYGARRSYNGGPYSSYHEGVDFSAYGGTPVFAAGDGVVVLAEDLYVRGGAVVIDHGLGIYSGYYHMSEVHAVPGQTISAGDLVGEVGSEGLSSGNHLHWDLLIAATWVDASAWHEQDLACWILEGWGAPCATTSP
ncbi:MAG: LysM peptidoglycan-binding domain-containing M23 family metallopeptidase [Chloroflexota bacterium]